MSGFYLDDVQVFSFAGDQVDLQFTHSPIPMQDLKAVGLQPIGRQRFTPIAKILMLGH